MKAPNPNSNLQRLYIGDYFADTLEFSSDQHAVFQQLLLYLWIEDPHSLKERLIRKHADLSQRNWRKLRTLLLPLLEIALRGIAQWREAVKAYTGQRLPPSEWELLRAIVLARDLCACVYCGSDEDLHVDHRIPVSRGGSTNLYNLATACAVCNQAKGSKLPEAWLHLVGTPTTRTGGD